MNTVERVKQYQKELSCFKETMFDLKAFLFGPFYFFYYGLGVHGVAFFFLPLVVFLPFTLFGFEWKAFWVILLLFEVFAGFYAPLEIKKYKQAYIERFKEANPDADVAYFSVSPVRLVLLSWLSGGLYEVYWAYKNWSFIQKNTKEDLLPVGRGWFFYLFFIYPLFLRIKRSAEKYVKVSPALMWCGTSYLLLWIFNNFLQFGKGNEQYILWIWAGGCAVSPFLLVPYQKLINEINPFAKTIVPLQKKLYIGEVLTVIVGMAMVGSGYWAIYSANKVTNALNNLDDNQQMAIGYLGGSYLRHTEGYSAFCAKVGTPMHKYPQRFKDVYQREYQNLADMLSAKGVSWEDFLNVMRKEMSGHLLQGAENKLKQIRQKLIISAMAHQDNVAPEKVEWKEEYVQILPLNRVCEFLDNGHELVFWEKDEIEQAVKQLKK